MHENHKTPGVYFADADDEMSLVHAYTDDDYDLGDIFELFAIGEFVSEAKSDRVMLRLSRDEMRKLKVQADAESFDHPEGYIEMCLDLCRFGEQVAGDPLTFMSLE
ncbi:MAG: hypothetical protein R3174_03490 [Gammaproteobacteria bacterium]|nr:hypothetical protein [Gammaproteobacteria bacterium]